MVWQMTQGVAGTCHVVQVFVLRHYGYYNRGRLRLQSGCNPSSNRRPIFMGG
jgi:hypothetical protein